MKAASRMRRRLFGRLATESAHSAGFAAPASHDSPALSTITAPVITLLITISSPLAQFFSIILSYRSRSLLNGFQHHSPRSPPLNIPPTTHHPQFPSTQHDTPSLCFPPTISPRRPALDRVFPPTLQHGRLLYSSLSLDSESRPSPSFPTCTKSFQDSYPPTCALSAAPVTACRARPPLSPLLSNVFLPPSLPSLRHALPREEQGHESPSAPLAPLMCTRLGAGGRHAFFLRDSLLRSFCHILRDLL